MEAVRERPTTRDHDAARPPDDPWEFEDPDTRQVLAGGAPATQADGRAAIVPADICRAVTADRAGGSQCQRMGWFALHETDGTVTQPLCSTHLRRLVAFGGTVLA